MRTTGAVMNTRAGGLRSRVSVAGHEKWLHLTPALIAEFCSAMQDGGYSGDTVQRYRMNLNRLMNDLPEDKIIKKGTLARWQAELLRAGYAARTVNLFLSPANSLLEYLNLRELQLSTQLKPQKAAVPELSRREYLHLLQTARTLGRERVYLLIKLFASTGLPVQELNRVTVEAVEEGRLTTASSGSKQIVRIPACLGEELLAYARRNGLSVGPIFRTRDGAPMGRTNVTTGIRQLCEAAKIPVEKGNPRCLKRLYLDTRAGIEANVTLLVEQAQERLLEEEQLAIGWEDNEG